MNTNLLDIKTASRKLGLLPRTVHHLADVGLLRHVRAGRGVLFIPADAISAIAFSDQEHEDLVRQKLSARSHGSDDNERVQTGR